MSNSKEKLSKVSENVLRLNPKIPEGFVLVNISKNGKYAQIKSIDNSENATKRGGWGFIENNEVKPFKLKFEFKEKVGLPGQWEFTEKEKQVYLDREPENIVGMIGFNYFYIDGEFLMPFKDTEGNYLVIYYGYIGGKVLIASFSRLVFLHDGNGVAKPLKIGEKQLFSFERKVGLVTSTNWVKQAKLLTGKDRNLCAYITSGDLENYSLDDEIYILIDEETNDFYTKIILGEKYYVVLKDSYESDRVYFRKVGDLNEEIYVDFSNGDIKYYSIGDEDVVLTSTSKQHTRKGIYNELTFLSKNGYKRNTFIADKNLKLLEYRKGDETYYVKYIDDNGEILYLIDKDGNDKGCAILDENNDINFIKKGNEQVNAIVTSRNVNGNILVLLRDSKTYIVSKQGDLTLLKYKNDEIGKFSVINGILELYSINGEKLGYFQISSNGKLRKLKINGKDVGEISNSKYIFDIKSESGEKLGYFVILNGNIKKIDVGDYKIRKVIENLRLIVLENNEWFKVNMDGDIVPYISMFGNNDVKIKGILKIESLSPNNFAVEVNINEKKYLLKADKNLDVLKVEQDGYIFLLEIDIEQNPIEEKILILEQNFLIEVNKSIFTDKYIEGIIKKLQEQDSGVCRAIRKITSEIIQVF